MSEWPDNADGDVFRRLENAGLNFSKPYAIDFNVDFSVWPPKPEAIALLKAWFPSTRIFEPDIDGNGYVQFQLFERVTYELVIRTQAKISAAMEPFGGVCESWGFLQD